MHGVWKLGVKRKHRTTLQRDEPPSHHGNRALNVERCPRSASASEIPSGHGATTEPVVFLQLTVPTGTPFLGQLSAQGRGAVGTDDWEAKAMLFDQNGQIGGMQLRQPTP